MKKTLVSLKTAKLEKVPVNYEHSNKDQVPTEYMVLHNGRWKRIYNDGTNDPFNQYIYFRKGRLYLR